MSSATQLIGAIAKLLDLSERRVQQLMRCHFNIDSKAAGTGLSVNAAIAHKGHLDFVEHERYAAVVKMLG
jgi:hypothetical protein